MIYVQDAAIEAAENAAHDADSDQVLAALMDMAVIENIDLDGTPGRAINVLLPTRDTGADPAVCQVFLCDDAVTASTPFDDQDNAQMIADQLSDASKRIAFCEDALHALGFPELIEKG